MPVIAVAGTKGGVGKTTTAVVCGELMTTKMGLSCVLLDMDAQESATSWKAKAEHLGTPLFVPVIGILSGKRQEAARRRELSEGIEAIGPDYGHAVIDTPPGDQEVIEVAIEAADYVIVPSTAYPADLERIVPTVQLALAAGVPHGVLLTRTREGTISKDMARNVLEDIKGLNVLNSGIPLREDLARAFGTYPTDESISDYAGVLAEVWRAINAQETA